MNRITEGLRLVLWSCVFIYVVFCAFQITQVDIWWQLPEGFHILRTFHLPTEPVAAFGLPAHPYFDEYAGYEVVLASLYQVSGFFGIWVLFISVYLAIMFLPSRYARGDTPAFDVFSALALLSAALVLRQRLDQRPELVGVLLLAMLMVLLRGMKLETLTERPKLAYLFLIFVVWTNVHGSFLFGGFTLLLWIGSEVVLKWKVVPVKTLLKNGTLLFALAFVGCLLNPYGLERLEFPFVQALDPGANIISPEMFPITDLFSVVGLLVMVPVALLAWGFLTTRRRSLWLALFSVFAVYMTVHSFRWISLLALSLLFVYAERDASPRDTKLRPLLVSLTGASLLIFLTIFVAIGAAFNFDLNYHEIQKEKRFVQYTSRFACDSFAANVVPNGRELPVFCDHSEGSFLSFPRNNTFRPIIETGLAHYSSDFKRYYFFAWHKPEAFRLIIDTLHVNYVITDKYTFHWILSLRATPGWTLRECSVDGTLWERVPGGVYAPTPGEIAHIREVRDSLMGPSILSAFAFSTLVDPPADSLDILMKHTDTHYPDMFISSLEGWLKTVPDATIQDYLDHGRAKANDAMAAILHLRLSPQSYSDFIKTVSIKSKPWYWKAFEVQNAIAAGDYQNAREILDTIPVDISCSFAFFALREEIREKDPGAGLGKLRAYDQWQTWDENWANFMASISDQLNDRIKLLDQTAAN